MMTALVLPWLHVLFLVWFYGLAPALLLFIGWRVGQDYPAGPGGWASAITGALVEAVAWPVAVAIEVGLWLQ